jgi:hypothetical protein
MILVIRGHIRDSFNTDELLRMVDSLYQLDPTLRIYIHTWNIMANNVSWRQREENHTVVTEEVIRSYFGSVLSTCIKHIIIDDDSKIELIGNLHGTIRGGPMPIIGWKNYWYGVYRAIDYLNTNLHDDNDMVINTRFDIMHHVSREHFLEFITKHIGMVFTKNKFIYDSEVNAVDNLYVGSIDTMYRLVRYFNYELDTILANNTDTIHQERYVYRMNSQMFA